jgi:endonuclease-3
MDKASETNPYQVLISCLLSLRSRDEITERVSEKLFAKARTPKQIAGMPLRTLEKTIHSINYYKTKARRIKQISQELVEKHNSKVPNTMEELLAFKGIGRKTANIVLVYGFGIKAMPVDVHVHVVTNRLGWVFTKNADKTEDELRKFIPKRHWLQLNDLLVMHGQNICLTRKPKCEICPINKYCDYYKKGVSHKRKTNS